MPTSPLPRIVVFGATGKVGQCLVHRLSKLGYQTLSVGRKKDVLAQLPGDTLVLDLKKIDTANTPLRTGDVIVNAAHARHTENIVKLCPSDIQRLVVMGSTRYLTQFHDPAADEVRNAISFLGETDLPWIILHPTMIYGAQGENNVQRIENLIRRFHVIPLPNGGRSLIQPIHVEDVIEALMRSISTDAHSKCAIHIAGPTHMTYASFIRAIAHSIDHRVWIMPMPYTLMMILAKMTSCIPGVPTITKNEVLRLLEDKHVELTDMQEILKFTPRTLSEGLAKTSTPPSH